MFWMALLLRLQLLSRNYPSGDSLRDWHSRTDETANCSITTMNMIKP